MIRFLMRRMPFIGGNNMTNAINKSKYNCSNKFIIDYRNKYCVEDIHKVKEEIIINGYEKRKHFKFLLNYPLDIYDIEEVYMNQVFSSPRCIAAECGMRDIETHKYVFENDKLYKICNNYVCNGVKIFSTIYYNNTNYNTDFDIKNPVINLLLNSAGSMIYNDDTLDFIIRAIYNNDNMDFNNRIMYINTLLSNNSKIFMGSDMEIKKFLYKIEPLLFDYYIEFY